MDTLPEDENNYGHVPSKVLYWCFLPNKIKK
jgi:hypothetical protein